MEMHAVARVLGGSSDVLCMCMARGEASPLNAGGPSRLKGKARYWRGLLESAVALHCFPPGGDPLPGEKRFVFMGHPKHTQAEVNFARRQGLWMVDDERGGCVRE